MFLSYTSVFFLSVAALSGTDRERRRSASPVVGSVVDSSFQESQLVKQPNCSLPSQALCPQIGHVFVGIRSSVSLGHL